MKPQQCSDDAPPNAPLNTLNVYLHFSPMQLYLLTRINSSTCCSSLRHVPFSCHWLDRERFPVEDLYQLYIDWFIDWFVDWLIDWLIDQPMKDGGLRGSSWLTLHGWTSVTQPYFSLVQYSRVRTYSVDLQHTYLQSNYFVYPFLSGTS